jgi:hypothetical protein
MSDINVILLFKEENHVNVKDTVHLCKENYLEDLISKLTQLV